ncbi:MAG: DUF58 domain-containing protein [Rubrobacter sp.]
MSGRSRLSVRLTSRGWQAVVIGALIFLVARLIGTTQLHQLGYTLLALPVASLLIGFIFARGLTFFRKVVSGERISAGSPSTFDLVVDNHSRFGTSSIEGTDRLPERVELDFDPMPPKGRRNLKTSVNFHRRGVYRLGPASLSVVDPFEILSFTRTFTEPTEVTVHPRVHKLPNLPVRGGMSDSGGQGRVGQRSEEFAGLREYRRGDDRRYIHWKSFARTGELYVRETSLHAPQRYTVALDLRRTGLRTPEGPLEDSVSAAASLLAHLRSEGLPARLVQNGTSEEAEAPGEIDFHTNEAAYWREMRVLATVRVQDGEPLAERLVKESGNLGEGVLIVCRNLDDDLPASIAKLVRDGLSVVVVLIAAHSYGSYGAVVDLRKTDEQERKFAAYAEGLRRSGAATMVVRRPEGFGGMTALSGSGVRT